MMLCTSPGFDQRNVVIGKVLINLKVILVDQEQTNLNISTNEDETQKMRTKTQV